MGLRFCGLIFNSVGWLLVVCVALVVITGVAFCGLLGFDYAYGLGLCAIVVCFGRRCCCVV